MSTRQDQEFGRERRRFLKGVVGLGAGAAIVLVAGQQGAQPIAAASPATRHTPLASQATTSDWLLAGGTFDIASRQPVRLAYSVVM